MVKQLENNMGKNESQYLHPTKHKIYPNSWHHKNFHKNRQIKTIKGGERGTVSSLTAGLDNTEIKPLVLQRKNREHY